MFLGLVIYMLKLKPFFFLNLNISQYNKTTINNIR
jgi:hypothetical protein